MRPARLSLVEYATAALTPELVASTEIDRLTLRTQLFGAGERLARLLRMSANPLAVGETDLRATDFAGIVRVHPRLELEVAPKFLGTAWPAWREDFFFVAMLSRHGHLLAHERVSAAPGRKLDLASLIARAMIEMFRANQRRPLRAYRLENVNEFAIDGDVDPESLTLPTEDGYAQSVVIFDRRNAGNATILRAVLTLLAEVRDPQIRRQLSGVAAALSPQSRGHRTRRLIAPSRGKRWQPLLDLAADVLEGFGIRYADGVYRAPGYVVDTWRIWEDLLTLGLRLAWGPSGVAGQKSAVLGVRHFIDDTGRRSTRVASVTPDVTTVDAGGLLVDAKYKGRIGASRNRVSEADLYEALAFASATQCKRVALVYPRVARPEIPARTGETTIFETIVVRDVSVFGVEVDVRGISSVGGLSAFADGLGAGLRTLADAPSLTVT